MDTCVYAELKKERMVIIKMKRSIIERALLRGCKLVGRPLSYLRGNCFVDFLVECCGEFCRAAGNVNFDMQKNGEIRILLILKDFQVHCIFDVGANIGEWSLIATDIFPDSYIHSFEIVPATFALLSDNVASKPRIKPNNFGLSKADGFVDVYLPEKDTTSATLYPVNGAFEQDGWYKSKSTCEVWAASRYLKDNLINSIDFLKIDVEGADLDVLLGFGDDIKKVRIFQFEYGVFNIASHSLIFDFWHFCKKNGFILGKIYPRRVLFFEYSFRQEDFAGNNYLAVRESEKDLIRSLATSIR